MCGYGTYSPTGLVPCLECPRNSYTGEPPTDGFKDCQACPANTYTYQPAAGGKEHCRGDLLSWLLSFLHFKILREQKSAGWGSHIIVAEDALLLGCDTGLLGK